MSQPASLPLPATPAAAGGRTITAEELLRLPRDGWRYALFRGELQRMTPAGVRHGMVIVNVTVPLGHHVKTHGLGAVCGAETGFVLARNPDTVLAPDVAFIRRERIPASGPPAAFLGRRARLGGGGHVARGYGPRGGGEGGVVALGRHARGLGRGPAPGVGPRSTSRAQSPVASRCRKFWTAHRCFPHSACRSPTSSRRHQRLPARASG